MLKRLFIGLIISTILTSPLFAFEPSEWKKSEGAYHQTVGRKLGFGLKNLLLGWTEFFNEPYASMHVKESMVGGFGNGLWHAVADTVGGALHLVTFWSPQLDIPLPHGGVKSGCTACSVKT